MCFQKENSIKTNHKKSGKAATLSTAKRLFRFKESKDMVSEIEEKIKQHTEKIKAKQYDMPQGLCPKCSEKPKCFKLHESRPRKFFFILADIVKQIESLLLRWKCILCKATFTEYPDFALPYKRYVSDDIVRLTDQYLEQHRETYRRLVSDQTDRNRTQVTAYEKNPKSSLAYSTPWHWIKLLGQLPRVHQAGLELIRNFEPSTELFRRFAPVAPRKYRSQARKGLLQKAKNLLFLNREHEKLFSRKIFPRFETLHL